MLYDLKKDALALASRKRAESNAWFFKTGKGEYGEGDVFIGLTCPDMRRIARRYSGLSLSNLQKLISSRFHEYRQIALFILVDQYGRSSDRKRLVDFYLNNIRYVNNWDLVDLSAHKILGDFLVDKNRDILYQFARSNDLWERRIAVISCFAFIDRDDFKDALEIAGILLHDRHDLIHKAVGWVLREVGKKDRSVLERFLKDHHKTMPRTMLRYSVERLPEPVRKFFMKR